jgi:spore coat-associated protein N
VQRLVALWQVSPLKLVGALFALMLAVAMAVGSGASFNAKTANANNAFTAGNLAHTNSGNGAIMTADKMKPGDSINGTVDIVNTGDINGVFTLGKSGLTDTPSSPAFSGKLDLKVEDLGSPTASPAPTPVVKYNGKLGAMGATALGTFTPNEKHRYKFTLTFPDGGTGGADNAYKGAATSVQFDWESVSS